MKLLLVDGHYYLYRSHFAIRGLTNSKGEPTNAIFGFIKALRKMIADLGPTHAAVIWDHGLPERRTALQPEYKQNRAEMPDDLRPQEIWLEQNIALLGPASFSVPNTEADDLIASYARAAEALEAEIVIATNDKDILQLVGERIRIYSTAKADTGADSFALLGPAEVAAKWGVPPDRIGDVLALTGDSSDNIPGVPGVGSKTAVKLVNALGPVPGLLARAAEIEPEKLRDKISASSALILANREMVRLDEHLPLPVPIDQLAIRPDYPRLIEAVKACEFKSLLAEIQAEAAPRSAEQSELF